MLTLEDCIALSELSEAEIDAIAQHEHVPEIIAIELGNYLVHSAEGRAAIHGIIRDDIADAGVRGDHQRAAVLKLVLQRFLDEHHEERRRQP